MFHKLNVYNSTDRATFFRPKDEEQKCIEGFEMKVTVVGLCMCRSVRIA